MALGMAEEIVRLGGTGARTQERTDGEAKRRMAPAPGSDAARGSVIAAHPSSQADVRGIERLASDAMRHCLPGIVEKLVDARGERTIAGARRAVTTEPAPGGQATRLPQGRAAKKPAGGGGRGVKAPAGRAGRARDDAGCAATQECERAAAPRGAAASGDARRIDPVAGSSSSTRARQARFARVLAETCNVAAAAKVAGRRVATVQRWRSVDASFAAAWEEALAIGYDRLENALLVYALGKIDGVAGISVSNADLQLAVGMVQRYRASDSGRRGQALPAKMPTEAETDAALKRALDGLARRGAPS